jgi:hypothetical protein
LVTLFAHVRCTPPEAVTTFGVGAAVAALVTRPWRKATPTRQKQRSLLAVVLALAVMAAGCGGSGSSSSKSATVKDRPTTTVRLQITSPTPNQITPPDVTVKVVLIGGTVVQRTTGPLTPTEGHIHLTLDGKLVSMAYTTEQVLPGQTPGPHAIEAEFVAVDHQPFKNRVKAAVLFQVQGP